MGIVKSLINLHKMLPHPEGGYYAEVYKSADVTQIYYLLKKNQKSHWHRLKKNEILHFYSGSPLIIYTSKGGEEFETNLIGSKGNFIFNVKKHTWFSMKSTGLYSLIGCTVAPAFKFSDLELAPKDWKPLNFNNDF